MLATDADAIEQFKKDSAQALEEAKAESKQKDERIGELTAELAQAKDAANIDVDQLVAARTELVTQVKAIDANIDPKGLTDAELRKEAVKSKLGDKAIEGASDDVITGMYRALTLAAPSANPVRDSILQNDTKTVNDAQASYVARLTRQNKEV